MGNNFFVAYHTLTNGAASMYKINRYTLILLMFVLTFYLLLCYFEEHNIVVDCMEYVSLGSIAIHHYIAVESCYSVIAYLYTTYVCYPHLSKMSPSTLYKRCLLVKSALPWYIYYRWCSNDFVRTAKTYCSTYTSSFSTDCVSFDINLKILTLAIKQTSKSSSRKKKKNNTIYNITISSWQT